MPSEQEIRAVVQRVVADMSPGDHSAAGADQIAVGADHGGFALKQKLASYLREKGYQIHDCGTDSGDAVDYPDFARAVGEAVAGGGCVRARLHVNTVDEPPLEASDVLVGSARSPARFDVALRGPADGQRELILVVDPVLEGRPRGADPLDIRDVSITNLVIAFTDTPAFTELELQNRPALFLGMRELRLFKRVAVDFGMRRVLFDLPKNN